MRGLARNFGLAARTRRFEAIELIPSEAAVCADELQRCGIDGRVRTGSAIPWAAESVDHYDVAIGNPPYVRFQFISEADRIAIPALERSVGASLGGVSNLWLPVLLGAITVSRSAERSRLLSQQSASLEFQQGCFVNG